MTGLLRLNQLSIGGRECGTMEDAIKASGVASGRNTCVDDLEVRCYSQGRASSWLTDRCLHQKLEDCMFKAVFTVGDTLV